jgi:MFS family permease
MINRSTSKRLLYTIFVSQSLFSAAQIGVGTLTAIVAARLAGSESGAGLPSSITTFAQAFTAFPIALLMGRFGWRLGLSFGYTLNVLGGVVGVIAILQGSFPLLLVSAALMGMGRASSEQSRFAAGEMFPEAERARMIGRIVFAGTIGAVGGPLLVGPSGRLMEAVGLDGDIGPWVGLVVLCGLAALITFFLLRPDPMNVARSLANPEHETRREEVPQVVRPLSTLLMLPKVQLAVLAVLISQTVMVVLMVMTPLHMEHYQHSRDNISLVIALHTLGMFGLSPLTGYLIDRFGRIPMLFVAALTLAAAALLAPVSTHEYVLAAALFLLGLGWNFGYVSGASLLADTLKGKERASVQGVNDTLVFLAAGIGSLGAGPLFDRGGYQLVSLAGLTLPVALIALIWWLNRPQLTPEAV